MELVRKLLIALWAVGCVIAMGLIPARADQTVLTVSGLIAAKDGSTSVTFDLSALEALGVRRVETRTPWHLQPVIFEGPTMAAVLDAVGATGNTVEVMALNDYGAIIPLSDFRTYQVLLATRANGEKLSRRDKGPLFIVYPFDSSPDLRNDTYYSRSVWQVVRMTIK